MNKFLERLFGKKKPPEPIGAKLYIVFGFIYGQPRIYLITRDEKFAERKLAETKLYYDRHARGGDFIGTHTHTMEEYVDDAYFNEFGVVEDRIDVHASGKSASHGHGPTVGNA